MNIDYYKNYQERTIAEYKVAIYEAEDMFYKKIKEKDIIGALEAAKLKVKLEFYLNQKNNQREKDEIKHKKS